ncbi:MAG TPA: nuclear transport factor 2 family protein [Solirubrobacterales bacterium]|jgi:predicted SnoaL-like aldol condensation-catalyzing enzyme|nr:nuclear transport factor 2 family protein [Solirubrobacterales bacterium]
MSDSRSNKDVVLEYYELAYVQGKPDEAAERFLGPSYVQHDPQTPDGKDPFITTAAGEPIGGTVEVKRVLAEGEMVVVHSHLRDVDPALLGLGPEADRERGVAIMNVYRVEDGRIVEHWDVFQPVPEQPANDNTMF